MIVIDASVVVKWMIKEDRHEDALAVVGTGQIFVAPDFVVWESLRALQKKVDLGQITRAHFLAIAQIIPSLLAELIPAAAIASTAAQLANDLRLSGLRGRTEVPTSRRRWAVRGPRTAGRLWQECLAARRTAFGS